MSITTQYNIGFIGGGNMSTAIAKGILKNGNQPANKLWVSGPRLQSLQRWKELGTNVTTKNGDVLCNCEIVFLGVKPGVLNEAIADCVRSLPEKVPQKSLLFLSMLAGTSIVQVKKTLQMLPKDLDVRVLRILPNTPMAVGAGSCVYTTDDKVTAEHCTIIEDLLKGCGIVEKIPEPFMDSLGVLTACGPAFIYIVIEALADGAVKQGVPRAIALRHAAQMVSGSGRMVVESGKHPGLLKDEVCSPGGTTICGVTALEEGKLRATFISAIEAATNRSKEMGKQ